jgi:hypothetical protein
LARARSSPSIRPITAASRAGQVAAGPVEAEIGHHRVDPVTLLGAEPDQAGAVPQQRVELAHLCRGDPRLGQQVRPQQLRQGRRVYLVFSELRNDHGVRPGLFGEVRGGSGRWAGWC